MKDPTPACTEDQNEDESQSDHTDNSSDSEEESIVDLNAGLVPESILESFFNDEGCSSSPSSQSDSADSDVTLEKSISSLSDSGSDSNPDPMDADPESPILSTCTTLSPPLGYKFVLDNIDKTVKPRHMTLESRTRSLHYVQLYCVRDRIDFSTLPDSPSTDVKCLYDILPSSVDYSELKQSLTNIVAGIIMDNIPFFTQDFKDLVPKHSPHLYSAEMKEMSHVVCTS